MSHRRRALGQRGEQIAALFLQQKGYRVIERNVRTRQGEIDLIAWDGDILVFVEVRTRTSTAYGTAAESVTWRKQRKLRELALAYLQHYEKSVPRFRFDVVAICCRPDQSPEIEHITHAF
ncbi:YraN family protein [Brevibacillus sp. MCWH]|uniref:YraN family protein n=1 Tax=Brevibacillus sp. MCWH TaxID=2508871 RepID=UPI0014912E55|nr:YraN family protein [Brevibacillus sp. MCWH]NNV04017.1 YraN family protein [Brevibacillus sp. MCWH]